MKYQIYLYCLIALILSSCNSRTYEPEGLTKLSDTELIERAKQKRVPEIDAVVFKNEQGDVLSFDSIQKIWNPEEWATDSYVDENGDVKELILRKSTPEDMELLEHIKKAFDYQPPIELIDIDCTKKQEILQEVFDSDQGMRTDGATIDPEVEHQNLTKVISLIEKCGMPTLDEVDDIQMSAIWVVFQHGDNANRKKYLPLLEQAAKNGDLKATQIAMMKDRTLMMEGEPQVYGTQVTKKGSEWKLYELSNPETVDKRRREMGFGPLQDYLDRWDIEFTVEQKE